MVTKLNVLNASRLLLMVIVSAALFAPLFVDADGETFKVSKDILSSKAAIGKDKKFEATVTFIPSDYSKDKARKFDLIVGGCKWSVKARKESQNVTEFKFYDGEANSGTLNNPKSFAVIGQDLVFKSSNDSSVNYVKCSQEIKFVPIEGGKYYLEVSLEGEILGLVLSSSNAVYYSPPEKDSYVIWVIIGAVGGSFLLAVAIIVGVCIFKCRKNKRAATKKKPDAIAMVAPSAEESKMPVAKELSADQKPTSDVKPSTSTTQTTEPPQVKKQASVAEVEKNSKVGEPKAKNNQVDKTPKAKSAQLDKTPKAKKEALKTAIEVKPKTETKHAQSKQLEKPPTPMLKPVTEVKADKKKDSKTDAKVKAKAALQNAPRSRIYHQPEDEGSDHLSDEDKPDKISPSVSVKVALSNESKTRSKNSTTTECTSNTKTTLEESTAKSMDSTQESSKRSTLKTLDSTQETSSKRSVTGETKTID